MYHTNKSNLIQRIKKFSVGAVLSASIIYGGCTASDVIAAAADIALEENIEGLADKIETRSALKLARNLAETDATRRHKHNTELREADVDIYRERGLSQARIDEERAIRNLDKSYTQPASPQPTLDTATQDALNAVLGRATINTGAIIKAVQEEYKKHPFDWERNTEMVANTYRLPNLTSDDKNKLQQIIETMRTFSNGVTKKELYKLYMEKEASDKAFQNYNLNKKHIINIESIIKLLEFIINHPDTNPRLRSNIMNVRYGMVHIGYPPYIRVKTSTLPTQEAVDLIRSKINLLEKVKDNLSLSDKELKSFYMSTESGIGLLELLLRTKLRKANPEFKDKEKIFLDIIKSREQLTQPEVIELAKEIGYFTRLRKTLNQIEIKPILSQSSPVIKPKIKPQEQVAQPTIQHKEILEQKAKLEEEIAKLKQIRELEEEIAKLKEKKEKEK